MLQPTRSDTLVAAAADPAAVDVLLGDDVLPPMAGRETSVHVADLVPDLRREVIPLAGLEDEEDLVLGPLVEVGGTPRLLGRLLGGQEADRLVRARRLVDAPGGELAPTTEEGHVVGGIVAVDEAGGHGCTSICVRVMSSPPARRKGRVKRDYTVVYQAFRIPIRSHVENHVVM